jgi:hypothetical protein
MAPIRVAPGSQRSGYGSFCFSLNVVLALEESEERPYMARPVLVSGSYESLKRQTCVVPIYGAELLSNVIYQTGSLRQVSNSAN